MNIDPTQAVAYALIGLGVIVTLISFPLLAIALGVGILFKEDIKQFIGGSK